MEEKISIQRNFNLSFSRWYSEPRPAKLSNHSAHINRAVIKFQFSFPESFLDSVRLHYSHYLASSSIKFSSQR